MKGVITLEASSSSANDTLNKMLDNLASEKISICDNYFDSTELENLYQDLEMQHNQGIFKKAAIGRQHTLQVEDNIRGDWIFWLPKSPENLAQNLFSKKMTTLMNAMNSNFYIGLNNYESHYAYYPAGKGYDKHIDQHSTTAARKITFILYLNKQWSAENGGTLKVFSDQDESKLIKEIEPIWGRLVLFRSEIFPHEVSKCFAPRRSLTGWFRKD